MTPENISILIFLAVLGILVVKDRKKIEFRYIMFTRRTNRGKDTIKRIGLKYSKFFKVYANVAIVVAIIVSVVGLGFLLKSLTLPQPGVKFLFPKIFPGEPSEGVQKHVSFVPIWYWIIAIFIIIVPHEFSHGFVAAAERIRIKSLGLMLFLIFPGAFVEPDEEQFKRSDIKTRLRVASVGSFANFIVFLVVIGIIFGMNLLLNQVFVGNGVYFSGTLPDTPADDVGLSGIITQINGEDVRDIDDLTAILNSVTPGEEIEVITTEGNFVMETIENPDFEGEAFMGISDVRANVEYKESLRFLGNPDTGINIFLWFYNLFGWVAFLDLNIAIANLLPMLPLDGGLIYQALLEKVFRKEVASKIVIGLSIFTFLVLLMNIIGIGALLV